MGIRPAVVEKIAGTTLRVTFVSSGSVPTTISSALIDKAEAVVNSTALVNSIGGGSFYAVHQLPTSPGWYINEWRATIQGNNYIERQFIRVRSMEVD